MGDLLTPEKITLVGVLGIIVWAFVKEWIVPGSRLRKTEGERDFWMGKALDGMRIADRATNVSLRAADVAQKAIEQGGNNEPKAG